LKFKWSRICDRVQQGARERHILSIHREPNECSKIRCERISFIWAVAAARDRDFKKPRDFQGIRDWSSDGWARWKLDT
jgi:hypothetical protein